MEDASELEEIININYLYQMDDILLIKKAFDSHYNSILSVKLNEDIYNDGYFFLEVSNMQANKGDMLIYICSLLEADLPDVTVFGDQSNDLDMFKIAGTKIAVGNACDELKKCADMIIDSNDNDGVSKYLSNLWNV